MATMNTVKSYVVIALLCTVVLSRLPTAVALTEPVTVISTSQTLRNVDASHVSNSAASAAAATPGILGTELNDLASLPCVHTRPSILEWPVSTNTTTSMTLPPVTITATLPASTVTFTISQIQPPSTALGLCFWGAADILTPCTALVSATHTTKTSSAMESKTNLFLAAKRYFGEAFKKLQLNITSDSFRSVHGSAIPANLMCGVAFWVAIELGLAVVLEFWGYVI